ncbi:aspartic peptidase domain-containing protein [Hygrophoropsis aurantiaca]|uniref:Aspartic peptidase domain-containing protein n=1 Tax=Hygrophoropsis aurantiaca TaxID=72124 RepID=A0ACB8AMA3_9AGAM|nr:aspartic peptidase domain-containing protein [Hygrophoropsis aurantiaca]
MVSQSPTGSARIALQRRSNLHYFDGTVNVSSLRAHITSAETKIAHGRAAYTRNTGTTLPEFHSMPSSKRSVSGEDTLTDDNGVRWYGDITVGTPPSTYTVDFDTGSADLFLPGPDCGSTCDGHNIYDPTSSSSSKDVNNTFTLSYGDGSTVLGERWTDTVAIAGYTATNQALGVASQYSSGFTSPGFAPDGLIGLAFKSISAYNADSIFQTLAAQGALPEQVLGVKLTSSGSGSELRVGGTDSALYQGGFTWTDVVQEGYWQISVDGININGSEALSSFPAIVDTGTTLILGQTDSVQQLYNSLGGKSIGGGLYTLPCASMPGVDISIKLGGKAFVLGSDTFNFGTYNSTEGTCVGGISGSDNLGDMWILGDIFLRNVYTVFDLGNSRVGYAELA